jgi:tetratricopeptide (TPR) repeat protein
VCGGEMKNIKYILMIILGLLFVGCSNAEEKINNKAVLEIDRGNYIKASYLLNDAIMINPNYLDGMVNYRNVYPRALDQANERIEEYKKVSDYKLEAFAYEDLLKLKNNYYYADDIIHQKLGMSLDLPTIEELYQLKSEIGEIYYKAGNELENRPLNRLEKRDKFYLYERGVELAPKYKDIVERRENAYEDALVKVMIKLSNDIPMRSKEKLDLQIKGNLARDKKRSIIRITPLNENRFDYSWANNKIDKNLNTGIKVSLNYKTVTPESLKKSVVPIIWYEQHIVQTKNGPVVKSLRRTYFRHDFYKSASVEVSFSYVMKDLSTGEIIGSGTFTGIGEDHYRWSVFSGNIPLGVSRIGFERKLKSRDELTNLAFADAISKLAMDIADKI